jgi:hypothetical protein
MGFRPSLYGFARPMFLSTDHVGTEVFFMM